MSPLTLWLPTTDSKKGARVDNADDDEAIEISFNQKLTGLTITVVGFAVDHRIFSSPVSELFDGASADNAGSYLGGNSCGDGYGVNLGTILESSGQIGTPAVDPNNIILGQSAAIIANSDLHFFLVSSPVSGLRKMQLVITEI